MTAFRLLYCPIVGGLQSALRCTWPNRLHCSCMIHIRFARSPSDLVQKECMCSLSLILFSHVKRLSVNSPGLLRGMNFICLVRNYLPFNSQNGRFPTYFDNTPAAAEITAQRELKRKFFPELFAFLGNRMLWFLLWLVLLQFPRVLYPSDIPR